MAAGVNIQLNQSYMKDETFAQYYPLKTTYEEFRTHSIIHENTDFSNESIARSFAYEVREALSNNRSVRWPPQQNQEFVLSKAEVEALRAWVQLKNMQAKKKHS
jgi:hypothetical protein